jgi:electron transport complex protein RnfG
MTDTSETISVQTDLTPKPLGIKPPKEQSWRLAAFAAFVALMVMLSDMLIGPSIALRAQEDQQAMLAQVLPTELYDNDPSQEQAQIDVNGQTITYYRARLAGKVSAVVMQLSSKGYAGAIKLLIAIKPDGTLTGVRVLSHNETPGLGDQIETSKSNWILQFAGLSLGNPSESSWGVTKDGGQFDGFTGATITPRGVVAGIKQALVIMREHQDALLDQTQQEATHG